MNQSTIKNDQLVECPLCREVKPSYQLKTLNKCNHTFCKPCLKSFYLFNGIWEARCPYENCDQLLEEAEMHNILYPRKTVSRSTPITKGWKFWKKEKALPANDIDCSSGELVSSEQFVDSINAYSEPIASSSQEVNDENSLQNQPEEVIIATTKVRDFSGLPESVHKYLTNLNTNRHDNDLDEYVSNSSKKDDLFIHSKVMMSGDIHNNMIVDSAPDVNNWNWKINKPEGNCVSRTTYNHFPQFSESFSKTSTDVNPFKQDSYDRKEPVSQISESSRHLENSCSSSKAKQPSKWDAESRTRLHRYIKEKHQKVVDFMFVAIEADLSLNVHPIECLMCQGQLSTCEGIIIPYCSHSFCRTCLTKPSGACQTECVDDSVVLYSSSSIQNKNCAIILNTEIKSLLMDGRMFAKFQKDFMLKKANMIPEIVDPIATTQCNPIPEEMEHNNTYQSSNSGNFSLIDFDTPSKEVVGGSNLMNAWSDVVLLRNSSASTCLNCYKSICAEKGVILRDCFHVLCDRCLIDTIMETLDYSVEVRCPLMLDDKRWCKTIIQEREIKSLLTPEQYDKYERKCLQAAQQGFESTARCFKLNCKGWIVFEGYKDSFLCPVCGNENCLSCKAIHHGKSCSGYMMQQEKTSSESSESTKRCPKCKATSTNAGVNNFIRCSQCKFVFNQPKRESKKWFKLMK